MTRAALITALTTLITSGKNATSAAGIRESITNVINNTLVPDSDGTPASAASVTALAEIVDGKEEEGVAATLLAAHLSAGDPHGQYQLESGLSSAVRAIVVDMLDAGSNVTLDTAGSGDTLAITIAATGGGGGGGGYLLAENDLSDVANKATAFSNIKQAATTSATGVVELATDGEDASGVVVQGNDARLSNARTPTAHVHSGDELTPAKVNGIVFSGASTPQLAVSGTASISGTNTGDQTTITGNAGTATKLAAAVKINGVDFDGSIGITVPAAASTLTGTTLASNVVTTSITHAAGGALGSAAYVSTSSFDSAGTALGLVNSLASSLGNSAGLNVGTTAGTVCAGDDSRLSNARTPTAHNHSGDALTPASVNGVQISGSSTPQLAVTGTSSIAGTNTGDNAVNSNYSGLVSNANHTGDATGSTVLTLATVNADVGSFTNANITVNAKGLITAASNGSGGGGSGTKTYAVWNAYHGIGPSSNYATFDTRNGIPCLEFDDTTEESTVFMGIMPEGASLGSGLKVRLHWMADTATSGNARFGAQIEAMTTDLDSDSFDSAVEAHTATSGTSGTLVVTEITLTSIDSLAAGGAFRLRVYRDATDGTNDTVTGDVQLVLVELRSAA